MPIVRCAICGKGPKQGIGVKKSGSLYLCKDHMQGWEDEKEEDISDTRGEEDMGEGEKTKV